MKRSHIIALAGISCALALICVVCSIYIEFMTVTFAILSAIFVSMPFTQNSFLGGILTYIATSIFAGLIGSINGLPFILFFGAYAVIQWLIEYKLYPVLKNKIVRFSIGYLLKIAYFEIVVCIIWFFASSILPELILFGKTIKLTYLILSLAGIPIFLLYDTMMHLLFKNLKILTTKIIRKSNNTTTPDNVMYNGEDKEKNTKKSSPFDFEDDESKSNNEKEKSDTGKNQ